MKFTIHATEMIWALTLVLTVVGGIADLRARRIPNWLTVSGFATGLGIHVWLGGWSGALMSLGGAVLALSILLPLVMVRGLGAGDWKLMGAVGACVGPRMMLFVLLASVLATGLLATVRLIMARRLKDTSRNLWVLVKGLVTFGLKPNPEVSLDSPGLIKLPFGAMVAVGTLICFAVTRWVP
jgi:prepilin peptidase CpaA